MTFRLVQRGHSPLVVCWLVGRECDDDLRAALPGLAIVATEDAAGSLTQARTVAGVDTGMDLVLVGYSRGVQAVRGLLVTGAEPMAVVTIDGTHASRPPAAWQVDVWRELAAEARRGQVLWVATCCLQRYVERKSRDLPVPYTATSTLLAQALDVADLAALQPSPSPLPSYPGPTVLELHSGDLHLLAYGSTDCDHDAHASQMLHVLPDVLRRYVAPRFDDEPITVRPEPGDPGLGTLRRALADLESGVREIPPGSNDGPRIREYLRRYGLRPPQHWCAAAFGTWMGEAGGSPIPGSAGALATMGQFVQVGRFVPKARLKPEHFLPGNVPVWRRPAGGPGAGHIGVIEHADVLELQDGGIAGSMLCIEGNSGPQSDRVARMVRPVGDPLLLGVGLLREAHAVVEPSAEQLANAARLVALSDELRAGVASVDEVLARIGG